MKEGSYEANQACKDMRAETKDPWAHRNDGMRCRSCMWYVKKADGGGLSLPIGRCRRHSPTMSGYPVVYESDWCGDHKLDTESH